MAGRELAVAEINELWEAWTPSEVAQRMSRVAAPRYVAAGWALKLFTGDTAENTTISKSPYQQTDSVK
jgi:hypothetical protein